MPERLRKHFQFVQFIKEMSICPAMMTRFGVTAAVSKSPGFRSPKADKHFAVKIVAMAFLAHATVGRN
jgi:hypothetical protein